MWPLSLWWSTSYITETATKWLTWLTGRECIQHGEAGQRDDTYPRWDGLEISSRSSEWRTISNLWILSGSFHFIFSNYRELQWRKAKLQIRGPTIECLVVPAVCSSQSPFHYALWETNYPHPGFLHWTCPSSPCLNWMGALSWDSCFLATLPRRRQLLLSHSEDHRQGGLRRSEAFSFLPVAKSTTYG